MTISTETIRQSVYSVVRALLVANKPNYSYDNATQTYSIVAEYGRQNAVFPYVVMNPASINVELLNVDGSGEDYMADVQLDLYALEAHRKVAIDAGLDSIRNTILTNQSSLQTSGLLLMQEPFDESNTTPFEDSGQVLNTSSIILKMKLA